MANLRRVEGPVPEEIVRVAMAEPSLRGRVFLCSKRREPLLADGKVVGFVTPHETKMGWRHGPIFVMPGYRRRGLVKAYYDAHPERLCIAFVADGNVASHRVHASAGFEDWKRGPGGTWMRRLPRAADPVSAACAAHGVTVNACQTNARTPEAQAALAAVIGAAAAKLRAEQVERLRKLLVDDHGWEEQERGTEVVFQAPGQGRLTMTPADVINPAWWGIVERELVEAGIAANVDEARRLLGDAPPRRRRRRA